MLSTRALKYLLTTSRSVVYPRDRGVNTTVNRKFKCMVVVHGFITWLKNPMICILCLSQTSLIEYDSSNTIGKSRKNKHRKNGVQLHHTTVIN